MNGVVRVFLTALLSGAAATAAAQTGSSGWSVGGGLRLWQMDWTTFSYAPSGGGTVLTQQLARSEAVWIPVVNVRRGDWIASFSGYGSTTFQFPDGERGTRRELDLNVGWYALPTLAITAGYKRVVQAGREGSYEPRGLVFGLSAAAPLGSALSVYGNLGAGRFATPSGNPIDFDAVYRLSELGLSYALGPLPLVSAVSLTAGWRMQTLRSEEALGSQAGRDITEGLTLGVVVRF